MIKQCIYIPLNILLVRISKISVYEWGGECKPQPDVCTQISVLIPPLTTTKKSFRHFEDLGRDHWCAKALGLVEMDAFWNSIRISSTNTTSCVDGIFLDFVILVIYVNIYRCRLKCHTKDWNYRNYINKDHVLVSCSLPFKTYNY